MNDEPANVVGIRPWLPWPLSAWSWWTEPVRAERLAILRVGVGMCLLVDLLVNYAPNTLDYYGKDGIGAPANFDYRFRAERMTWSLLRGVGDPTNLNLSLSLWLLATLWIIGNAIAGVLLYRKPTTADHTSVSLWIWSFSLAFYVAGLWSQMLSAKEAHEAKVVGLDWTAQAVGLAWTFTNEPVNALAWIVPLIGVALACFIHFLELLRQVFEPAHRVRWLALGSTLAMSLFLVFVGFSLTRIERVDPSAWWVCVLRSWQADDTLLLLAMGVWIGAACFLLLGCCTRLAAVVTWMASMSFANANPYLDNAGDTIRAILLFYLMLCPCGAVWSLDALCKRFTSPERERQVLLVHPWPLRLLFVQMIFIYFMNGLYKLTGDNWIDGDSLHYVLSDMVMTRFSQFTFAIPPRLAQIMTWTVLVWETAFPILVLWKWPRRAALIMGVMFHVGIFATMELGGFVPYALCMYLPLLPWPGKNADRNPPPASLAV